MILIIVALVTFGNTLMNSFIWDDVIFLRDDPYIKISNPLFFLKPDYWIKYFRGTPGRYRPLRSILFSIEYRLWGLNPMFYHLRNIVLHTIVVVLIFLFLKKWVFFDNERLAFLTSLVFAVHPVHVESVAWIKNCTDIFCLIFFILSFHFFLKSQESMSQSRKLRDCGYRDDGDGDTQAKACDYHNNTAESQSEACGYHDNVVGVPFRVRKKVVLSVVYYILAIVFYILSVLAKEMGVTLPVVILAYLWIVRKEKNLVKNLIKLSGYIVLLIAVFIYKVFVLEPEAPLTVEISYIIKTFGEYVQILLFPFNLCAERNLGKVMSFFEPTFLLGIFSLIVITLIFVYIKNLRFPLAFFMITILPVLNIIYLVGRPLAEQRMYIPSLGFCMVLGYIFDRMWEEKLTQKIFVLLVALYAIVAIDRNFDWRDPITFWEKTLYQTGSPRAFLNLGEAYLSIGDNELGIRVSKQALRYDPSFVGALANIGIGYMKLGEKEKALECFYKSLMMQPYDANNYVNFAVALLEQGHLEEAKKILEKGLQLDDKNALLHYTLGNVYAQLKHFDKAAEHFKTAMFLNPDLKIAERNYKQALLDMQHMQQKSN